MVYDLHEHSKSGWWKEVNTWFYEIEEEIKNRKKLVLTRVDLHLHIDQVELK